MIIHSLYARLSLVLAILFVAVGIVFFFIAKYATDMYYQEVTQRLNASVARYIATETQLMQGNDVNRDALKNLAHHAMIVNPTLEVYLLDPQGQILAHALGERAIQQNKVDLKAIRTFIAGDTKLPLLGEDPRDPTQRKIFSVAEIRNGAGLQGYVYVVLGGHKYQQLAASLYDSYVIKISVSAIIACLVFGLLCGLIIFAWMTRRLRHLTRRVDSSWESSSDSSAGDVVAKDEIGRLSTAFDAMKERIRLQMEQIRQTDQTRRELITNISHDLRTPLTAMQGYIETLLIKQKELDSEKQRNYLETARRHGVSLNRLVADLFELAKLDNNAVKPNFETFSLAELVNDIAQEFRLHANSANIGINIDSQDQACVVTADIGLIERVFQNLMDNALHHTPADGEITISLEQVDSQVQVRVSDTGCGISEEVLPYIFDRFYHVKVSGGSPMESTGLGLAIVKRILDLHKSHIHVKSSVNSGTSFSFNLGLETSPM